MEAGFLAHSLFGFGGGGCGAVTVELDGHGGQPGQHRRQGRQQVGAGLLPVEVLEGVAHVAREAEAQHRGIERYVCGHLGGGGEAPKARHLAEGLGAGGAQVRWCRHGCRHRRPGGRGGGWRQHGQGRHRQRGGRRLTAGLGSGCRPGGRLRRRRGLRGPHGARWSRGWGRGWGTGRRGSRCGSGAAHQGVQGRQVGQLGRSNQSELHHHPGQAAVPQVPLAAQQQVQHASPAQQLVGAAARAGLGLQAVPEGQHQLPPEGGPVSTLVGQLAAGVHQGRRVSGSQGGHDPLHQVGADDAQLLANGLLLHASVAGGDDAVQDGEGIAHGALPRLGHQPQAVALGGNALVLADMAQAALDEAHGDQAERVDLHPALDGVGDVLQLGGGQHEDGVGRRLFDDLQQGVEGLGAEHVHFIDDVDPVAAEGGAGLRLLPQGPGIGHGGPAGGVDLDDVQAAVRLLGSPAGIAHTAGRGGGTLGAVEGPSQDAGRAGLARAAHAGEEVGLVDAAALLGPLEGVGQGLHAALLPHEVGQGTGTVLEGKGGHDLQSPTRHGGVSGAKRPGW